MSDYDNDDDLDTTDAAAEKRNWRRDLEEQAKQAKAAQAEADAARRELALIKAGIDLDSPQGKLFAKGYDGTADVAAIKAQAIEYGILPSEVPDVPPAELAAHDRVASAAQGATQVSEEADAFAALEKAGDWLNGGTPQQVLEVLRANGVPIETSKPGGWMRPEGAGAQPLS